MIVAGSDRTHLHAIPELQTGTLMLNAFDERDAQALIGRQIGNPWLARNGAGPGEIERESQRFMTYLCNCVSLSPDNLYLVWTVRRLPERRILGTASFAQVTAAEGYADCMVLGGRREEEAWMEVMRTIIAWAFSAIGSLQEIRHECDAENKYSSKMLSLCGLSPLREQLSIATGCRCAPRRMAEWRITREEFLFS